MAPIFCEICRINVAAREIPMRAWQRKALVCDGCAMNEALGMQLDLSATPTEADYEKLHNAAVALMETLPDDEGTVMVLLLGLDRGVPRTAEEVAAALDMPIMAVADLERSAVVRLRNRGRPSGDSNPDPSP